MTFKLSKRTKIFCVKYVHTKLGSDYNGTISVQTPVVFLTVSLNVIPKQGGTLNAKQNGKKYCRLYMYIYFKLAAHLAKKLDTGS